MEAEAEGIKHMRNLINREEFSDLEFICKNEVRVHANSMFLIGRSEVFDEMLESADASSVLNLPEISAAALLSILEFLYTSRVSRYGPADWKMGLEMMSAAQFFHISKVEDIILEYLAHMINDGCESAQQIAIVLTTAMTFTNLSHDTHTILLELVTLLGLEWINLEITSCLSEEALDFILRYSKPDLGDRESSLIEYITEIVPLLEEDELASGAASPAQANKVMNGTIPVAATKLVDAALPRTKEELYGKRLRELSSMEVTWLPKSLSVGGQDELIQFFHSHSVSKEAAMRLLVHVDWVRIPAALFVKVVEPLGLISDAQLVNIFRFHALERPVRVVVHWSHDSSHILQQDGLVVQNDNCKENNPSKRSAVCHLANRLGDQYSVWRFTVEEFGSNVQTGFLCGEVPQCPDCLHDELGSLSSYKYVSRVIKWSSRSTYPQPKVWFQSYEDGCLDGHEVEGEVAGEVTNLTSFQLVEFRYDRSDRSCAITVDGKDYGKVWRDLPCATIFPMVNLGLGKMGRVRLDIVSGFEIF